MKTIIVPTDFSQAAANAVNYAVAMAKEINASITLLHVYQVPITITADAPIIVVAEEDIRRSAEGQLYSLKADVEKSAHPAIKVYAELRLGDTVTELEELSGKLKPFAVVMGSNGHSGLEQTLFGSTTLKAIRHLTWPVIAVPPGAKYSGIRKIGFACDFQQVVATTPSQAIKDFVKNFNAEFHVLNVDYENRHFKPETPEESLLIHTLLEELKPVYDFIENPDVEQGIDKFAEKNNLDLLITIPKKHKLLDGLFRKSATKQLVFHSRVPLMCVHE
ncbi:MAG: universal stress protein [Bacteroidota bacterium]